MSSTANAHVHPALAGVLNRFAAIPQQVAEAELFGKLSPVEQAMLDDLNTKTLIPFHVTVTVPGVGREQINLLAPTSCDAVIRALEIMFPDFDEEKPAGGLAIKVEAITPSSQMAA